MLSAIAIARRRALSLVDSTISLLVLADAAILVAMMCAGRLG